MTPTPNSNFNVNIINATGDNAIAQAGPNGTIYQVNHAPPREQALALCDELLQATSGKTGDHSALRKATRDLQGELEQDAQVSEPTKTRLQRAAEALPTTEKAVGIAAKLVELLCKLPSIG